MIDLKGDLERLAERGERQPPEQVVAHALSSQPTRAPMVSRGALLGVAAGLVAVLVGAMLWIGTDRDSNVEVSSSSQEPGPTVETSTSTAEVRPEVSAITDMLSPGSSAAIPSAPIQARSANVAVWTGDEIIVWGGSGDGGVYADGTAYDVAAGTWRTLAPSPLTARDSSSAVWTGDEVLIWGGQADGTEFADGAAYDPELDDWRLLPAGGPEPSGSPVAVWSGSEMIVIGGAYSGPRSPEAAAYDPAREVWTTLSAPPAAAEPGATAVWTRGAVYVLGLSDVGANIGDVVDVDELMNELSTTNARLDRYDRATDSWTDAKPPVSGTSLVATDDNLLLLNPLPTLESATLDLVTLGWDVIEGPPRGTPLATGKGVWTGNDIVFADGSDWAVVYRPSTRTWGRVRDGSNINRAGTSTIAVDGLVARWSGFPLNPTSTASSTGSLLRPPEVLDAPAPIGPPEIAAESIPDLLTRTAPQSLTFAAPDLGWTLTITGDRAEVTDEQNTILGALPIDWRDDSIMIGPIGEIPPPSGRWRIGIVSTSPRLAVLPQPEDDWNIIEPASEINLNGGNLYVYEVDGGPWSAGYNTVAYPT